MRGAGAARLVMRVLWVLLLTAVGEGHKAATTVKEKIIPSRAKATARIAARAFVDETEMKATTSQMLLVRPVVLSLLPVVLQGGHAGQVGNFNANYAILGNLQESWQNGGGQQGSGPVGSGQAGGSFKQVPLKAVEGLMASGQSQSWPSGGGQQGAGPVGSGQAGGSFNKQVPKPMEGLMASGQTQSGPSGGGLLAAAPPGIGPTTGGSFLPVSKTEKGATAISGQPQAGLHGGRISAPGSPGFGQTGGSFQQVSKAREVTMASGQAQTGLPWGGIMEEAGPTGIGQLTGGSFERVNQTEKWLIESGQPQAGLPGGGVLGSGLPAFGQITGDSFQQVTKAAIGGITSSQSQTVKPGGGFLGAGPLGIGQAGVNKAEQGIMASGQPPNGPPVRGQPGGSQLGSGKPGGSVLGSADSSPRGSDQRGGSPPASGQPYISVHGSGQPYGSLPAGDGSFQAAIKTDEGFEAKAQTEYPLLALGQVSVGLPGGQVNSSIGPQANAGGQGKGRLPRYPDITMDALGLGSLVVMVSTNRDLLTQTGANGDILTSLSHQNLPDGPKKLGQLFVDRVLGVARTVVSAPATPKTPLAPSGRLLQPHDTASVVLLCTQGDVNDLRSRAPDASALNVLGAFVSMSRVSADDESLLMSLSCYQLAEVLVNATRGLEKTSKGPPAVSTANLSDFLLTIFGIKLAAGTPLSVRTDVAVLALTLYDCVADNGAKVASRDHVEMVNRILVQKYRSPDSVGQQPESVTNAQLLARVLKRVPEAASARVENPAATPSPTSPNINLVQNRKMTDWGVMNVCTNLVLKLAGFQGVKSPPSRPKQPGHFF